MRKNNAKSLVSLVIVRNVLSIVAGIIGYLGKQLQKDNASQKPNLKTVDQVGPTSHSENICGLWIVTELMYVYNPIFHD